MRTVTDTPTLLDASASRHHQPKAGDEPILVAEDAPADPTAESSLDNRIVTHLVVHGCPTSVGGLAAARAVTGTSATQRARVRLRAARPLVDDQPTAAGLAQVDQRIRSEPPRTLHAEGFVSVPLRISDHPLGRPVGRPVP